MIERICVSASPSYVSAVIIIECVVLYLSYYAYSSYRVDGVPEKEGETDPFCVLVLLQIFNLKYPSCDRSMNVKTIPTILTVHLLSYKLV